MPGSRTIVPTSRVGRARVYVQHPQAPNLGVTNLTHEDADQILTCQVDMNSVPGVLFILAFGYENKMFQDIITCDDPADAI